MSILSRKVPKDYRYPADPPIAIYKPLPCIILGVDAGKEWGAAIFVNGKPHLWANYSTDHTIEEIVTAARELADWTPKEYPEVYPYRLVICAEKWTPYGKRMTIATVAGLNAEFGVWLAEIRRLPARKPATKIVRFYPQTWRHRVLRYADNSADWKQRAVDYVNARWDIDVDHNTAEAICIAYCGSLAHEVAAVLGKREMKNYAKR